MPETNWAVNFIMKASLALKNVSHKKPRMGLMNRRRSDFGQNFQFRRRFVAVLMCKWVHFFCQLQHAW